MKNAFRVLALCGLLTLNHCAAVVIIPDELNPTRPAGPIMADLLEAAPSQC